MSATVTKLPEPPHRCEGKPDVYTVQVQGSLGWAVLVPSAPGESYAAAVVRVRFCPWCGVELIK